MSVEPDIGVFLCHCGTNIAGSIDMGKLLEFTKGLKGVRVVKDNKYTCSEVGQTNIRETVKEHNLQRVVVCSCAYTLHEKTFRIATEEAGLNPYMFQMGNIREGASWIAPDQDSALKKAKQVVAAAVARVHKHSPLEEEKIDVNSNILVVGGGIAGMEASLQAASAGSKVYLLERTPSIGGRMAQFDKTFPTLDCSACILTPKMVEVARHPNIELLSYAEVAGVEGVVGNYQVKIKKKAKSVDESLCTGCGDCWDNCPVQYKPSTELPKMAIDIKKEELPVVNEIISRHKGKPGAVMPVLQDINDEFKYLPSEHLKHVAVELDFPLSTVYRMATFYNAFSLKPRGDHLINVCLGTTCHVRGAPRLLERIKSELKVEVGETTEDQRFTLVPVRCLGCCSLAPVITVDGEAFGNIRPNRIPKVLKRYE